MLFNSFEFMFFLPIVFLLYWFVFKTRRLQNLFLVVASYIFYGWWDWRFLLLIVFISFCSFCIGILLERYEVQRHIQKIENRKMAIKHTIKRIDEGSKNFLLFLNNGCPTISRKLGILFVLFVLLGCDSQSYNSQSVPDPEKEDTVSIGIEKLTLCGKP